MSRACGGWMLGMIALSSRNCISSTCRLHTFRPAWFSRSSGNGCEAEAVVHRMSEVLLTAQVSFRRLNRGVAEQKLNLLQFAAARMTQLRASSAEIVWRNTVQPRFLAAALHHIPDHILRDSLTPNLPRPAHPSENLSLR